MEQLISELEVAARPTAVIAESTSWQAFPGLWRELLDEVWATVRASDTIEPDRNVMYYKDDVPNVEVGVEVAAPFEARGRVVCSALPAGRVLTTTHRGPYERLNDAHEAVIAECERRGLVRLGPRWEIYGHMRGDAPQPEVEVYWLVA